MPEVKYVCVGVTKRVTEDSWVDGHVGDTLFTMLDQRIADLDAPSVDDLVAVLGKFFDFPVQAFELGDQPGPTLLVAARLERADTSQPSAVVEARWRSGRTKLYDAQYEFRIERHVVEPVPRDEVSGCLSRRVQA